VKKKKIFLAVGIIVMAVLSVIIGFAIYHKINVPYEYYVNEDGTVTLDKYLGEEANVVIPETIYGREVKVIDVICFYDNQTLETVTIPDTVEIIESRAFGSCYSLETVYGGANVREIESHAFSGCRMLSAYPWSDELESIGDYAFLATGLTEIILPSEVRTIGNLAFANCFQLVKIEIPEGVEEIGRGIFDGVENIPELIGYASSDYLIVGQGILINYPDDEEIVVIPEGVKQVASCCHDGEQLKELYIPEGVTRINKFVVLSVHGVTIYIPSTATEIGKDADGYIANSMEESTLVVVEGSYGEEYAEKMNDLYGTKYIVVDKIEYPEAD